VAGSQAADGVIGTGTIPESAADFLVRVHAGFENASRGGVLAHEFEVAGVAISMEIAGAALEPALTRALGHLSVAGPLEPTLRLRAWDTESTGVGLEPSRWDPFNFGPLGEIRDVESSAVFANFADPGILSLFDRDRATAYYWTARASNLPGWEHAAPARSLLGAMLRPNDRHLVHGAAIGVNGSGALLVGHGGAGKSSTAMACLARGHAFLGDDYCAVSEDPEPTVHSIFSSSKLLPADAALLTPPLGATRYAGGPGDEKEILFFAERRPSALLPRALPLRAIFAPRLGDGAATNVRAIRPMNAVLPVLTSTAAQTPGVGGELLVALSRLARALPCFELRLGSNRTGVIEAIERTMEGVA
jgi:hypothetical protein